jgi:hypothetical protein
MTSFKSIFLAGIVMLFLWLSGWIFNHLNPYAGILLGIGTLVILVNFILKQYDKKP